MCRLNTLVCGAERKQLWQKRFCRKLCSSRSSKQTTAYLKKPATSQNRCTTVASSKSCLYIFLRMFLPATCYCNPCLLSQTLPAIPKFACYPKLSQILPAIPNFACYAKLCLLSQTLPAIPNFVPETWCIDDFVKSSHPLRQLNCVSVLAECMHKQYITDV